MPKVETRYYCDVCGKLYKDNDGAVNCEKSHLIPEGLSTFEFWSNDSENQYPVSILVHFKDGKSAKYYRR